MIALSPSPQTGSGSNVPAHIAIVMDGNGRWAKQRGLPRTAGHKKGADTLRETIKGCVKLGVSYLTIYAFSNENWKRPAIEVLDLMNLLRHYLRKELATLHEQGVRIRIIGDASKLPEDIRELLEQAATLTRANTRLHLTVALSYGARQEILQALRRLAVGIAEGIIRPERITEQDISRSLYTHDLPDPDLVIRTGGEQRLSNFLLWQSAYAELYFTPVLWPDFTPEDLAQAVEDFAKRERRYGNAES